ncbi:MAG TPA: hypothetical protein VFC82_09010 [Actinomycetaceae bacterium]|nr:hypothetical protein [Actinomycetaceae bacterium]
MEVGDSATASAAAHSGWQDSLRTYAEFLRRLGHSVVNTESGYWYNAQTGFYFRFPYHRVAEPSPEELRAVRRRGRYIGLRYFTPMTSLGKSSYLMVCSDKDYGFASLDRHSARRETRRAVENLEIREIPLDELGRSGYALYCDTLARQGRDPCTWTPDSWRRYCEATQGLDGFAAWGAFAERQLAAFLFTFLMEDHLTFIHQCSDTRLLKSHANGALIYTVTREALSRREVDTVQYGPQSLDAPASLDEFKRRMGFVPRPMKQRIVLNPVLRPLVGDPLHDAVQRISVRRPESDRLRKLNGIIRFYRETE